MLQVYNLLCASHNTCNRRPLGVHLSVVYAIKLNFSSLQCWILIEGFALMSECSQNEVDFPLGFTVLTLIFRTW